jgi:K+-transporting ATPase A subunit
MPDWLRRTLRLAHTSAPWHDVARSGVAVSVPLGIGIAVHQVQAGLFGTLGAYLGVLAVEPGPVRRRVLAWTQSAHDPG